MRFYIPKERISPK